MESGGELTTSKTATEKTPMWKIVLVASIAAGVQFGWALQLSLLTPYVQLLGVAHTWAAYLWLCGPISGMLVQPIVGYHSDRCTSRFGRRRPFIAAGAAFVAVAVVLIGYAADIGRLAGDDMTATSKPRAIVVFAVGFWVLDVANNMLQGPCRAFLADLSGGSQQKMRSANSLFSFFMAVGNVLGYAAGSYSHLYKILPFTRTGACEIYCANLKTCFFISITLLLILVITALTYVKEEPWSPAPKAAEDNEEATSSCGGQVFGAFKQLKKPMRVLLLVTCLNWIAWFPFLLYDTDWMGREVYGGDSNGDAGQMKLYDRGVHAGALGLMIQSVVLGFMSLGLEVSARWLGGPKKLWGLVNFILAIGLASTVLITKLADQHHNGLVPPPVGIRAAALAVFALLGIPLAITFSVPFALASIFSSTSGAGQGLSLGVLNLSIVLPQMLVSVASGPLDALFGGGNLPAFVAGAIAAVVSSILALTMLPSLQPEESKPKTTQSLTAFH